LDQLRTIEAATVTIPEVVPPAAGRTALELLARPVEEYRIDDTTPGPRPLRSTPTQQRTFDQQANRPDTQPDISQE
jgi:hypothetical protein